MADDAAGVVRLRAEVVRAADEAAAARVMEAAAPAMADLQERLPPLLRQMREESPPPPGVSADEAAMATVCEQVALAFRKIFDAGLHIVVGRDVTAAVRVATNNRMLLRVTASGLGAGSSPEPAQQLTVLVYQSVSARALPPVDASADAELVSCRPEPSSASAPDGAEESEGQEDEDEEEDGFVDVKGQLTGGPGRGAPGAAGVEVCGRYGDASAVGGVLLAVERSIAKRCPGGREGQRARVGDADVERIAQTVRQSLSREYGHLWHVLASRGDVAVSTSLHPAPEVVVKCRAAGLTWVVFRHSGGAAAAGLDWALFRREMVKNGRLVTLVFGGLALFYFHTVCDGSLSSLTAPAPAGESDVCYCLRTVLPWMLAALSFLVIVPRIQASARRKARRRHEREKAA